MAYIIKNHKYSIEERARRKYKTTDYFEFAGYILEDGTMLNFSHKNRQRDMDHREIEEFFTKAQGTDALCKFMRRGNIRVSCNSTDYCFELSVEPTVLQWRKLMIAALTARRYGANLYIEYNKTANKKIIIRSYDELTAYLTKRKIIVN